MCFQSSLRFQTLSEILWDPSELWLSDMELFLLYHKIQGFIAISTSDSQIWSYLIFGVSYLKSGV